MAPSNRLRANIRNDSATAVAPLTPNGSSSMIRPPSRTPRPEIEIGPYKLQEEIGEYNKAIDFFQSKLPPEKEMDKVLREVWQLAQANDLVTKGIRTLKRSGTLTLADSSGPYAEQPIEFCHRTSAGLSWIDGVSQVLVLGDERINFRLLLVIEEFIHESQVFLGLVKRVLDLRDVPFFLNSRF